MELYSGHINRLIEELASLPGIGGKSAQRLAFYIINLPKDRVKRLADSITDARENVHYCMLLPPKNVITIFVNFPRWHWYFVLI